MPGYISATPVAAAVAGLDKEVQAKITADVKARLAAAPSLKDLSIDVSTSAAVVTLKGMAKKPTQKGTATRVAKAVKCVKSVDNQMTVEDAAEKKPAKAKNSNKM